MHDAQCKTGCLVDAPLGDSGTAGGGTRHHVLEHTEHCAATRQVQAQVWQRASSLRIALAFPVQYAFITGTHQLPTCTCVQGNEGAISNCYAQNIPSKRGQVPNAEKHTPFRVKVSCRPCAYRAALHGREDASLSRSVGLCPCLPPWLAACDRAAGAQPLWHGNGVAGAGRIAGEQL